MDCQQFYLQWKFVQLPPSLSIPLSQIVEKNSAVFHIMSSHSHWIMFFTLCRITLLSHISHFQDKNRKLCILPSCCLFLYSSNRISCKVCSPSCFLLMDFWNLHSYCCTTSLGRQDFCGDVLPRVLQGLETYHTLKILTSVVLPLVV